MIEPQPGPQLRACQSPADIVIFGGEAGGGKTYWLVLEGARYSDIPGFGGAIFRRTSPELVGAGSIWEEANGVYRHLGASMVESPTLRSTFPSGALIQFLHLQHERDVYDHQSKQYAFVGLDELTHFTEFQFWYLVSRMRTTCGVRPYMRCTCNPDPDSFVRKLIAWWIGADGYPVTERDGVLRWFIRDGDTIVWADSPAELEPQCRPGQKPLSLTFIRSRLKDNPALTRSDPDYEARIQALPEVERLRLGGGNWDIRPETGGYCERQWFAERWGEPRPPCNIYLSADFAVDAPQPGVDPDETEFGVFGTDPKGNLLVLDWWHGQVTSDVWIEALIDKIARWKPHAVFGEAGIIQKAVEPALKKRMRERKVYCRLVWVSPVATRETTRAVGYKDPSKRAKAKRGVALQARAAMGKFMFPENREWADRVLDQLCNFPVGKDDAFDVCTQMCRVIDQAHPAIVKPEEKPERERDYSFSRKRERGDSWRTS